MLPADANDRIDPAEPTDRIEPADPAERIEPTEATDRIEPVEAADRIEAQLIALNRLQVESTEACECAVSPVDRGVIVSSVAAPGSVCV